MDEFCSGFAASLRGVIYKARLDGCVAMDAPPRVGDRKVKNRGNRDSCHVSRGKKQTRFVECVSPSRPLRAEK